jgi:MarR family transcriptional regulator for hemolysin
MTINASSDFGFELAVASRRWRKRLDEALAEFGLTDATWRPLLHLGRLGDGARQNDLARSLGIEGPSLVRLLDRLEAAALIERREDAADRRAKTLHLTAEGRALLGRLQAVVRDAWRAITADIDPSELETCGRVLAQLAARTEGQDRP